MVEKLSSYPLGISTYFLIQNSKFFFRKIRKKKKSQNFFSLGWNIELRSAHGCARLSTYDFKLYEVKMFLNCIYFFRMRDSSSIFIEAAGAEDDTYGQKQGSKVMSSYTLDLKSVIQTNRVDNIIDLQFLHGYNQPTLAILYEPLKTFAGRIAVRKDTCRYKKQD
jgi:hypothetical protein